MRLQQLLFVLPFFMAASAHALPPRAEHNTQAREIEKRDDQKYIFMHHIVGNTVNYSQADWEDDFRQIAAKGVDAVALNLGKDDWQPGQITNAYNAADAVGGIKLFQSFDFTSLECNVDDVISRVKNYSNRASQFKVDGKVFVSSFSGDCLGNDGWQKIKTDTNAYLMPFIFGIENHFKEWTSLDTWQCWGCAWPQGNNNKTLDDDNYYRQQQLQGTSIRYSTVVSPWFYTHYGAPYNKNWYYRGDDFLFLTRFEQMMSLRNDMQFIELATWNDYGESHYMGPIKGAQPPGTTWVNGFPHTEWYNLAEYYIKAWKTGNYPAVTEDVVYYWARPHPALAQIPGDSLGPPLNYQYTSDTLWAVAFATATSEVTLTVGSSTQTFTVNAGVNKLQIPLAAGKITVTMKRGGSAIINQSPSDYTFNTNPTTYNYNAYVGAARRS